jgi:mono/diheme cytochrome c family protein
VAENREAKSKFFASLRKGSHDERWSPIVGCIVKPRTASASALFPLIVIAAGVFAIVAAAAQRPPREAQPPLTIDSLGATDSYEFYCAPCHGKTGKGDGPVGAALRVRPADLTTLAERNGGVFPRERVAAYITGVGRPVAAHGTSDMPVWGPAFRSLDATDTRAQVRVSAIVDHLESLQAAENGAALYRAHCAGCHGPSGRGGPAVNTRKAPPDLTKYAMRNGGVFPSERLAQIIDGRHVPSHLDRDMPVWGATFKRTTKDASDAAVKARIDALVRFLQSIQERPAE